MDEDFKPLVAVRKYRGQTAELIAYAIVLALAINLISGAISALGTLVQACVGVVLIVGAALYVRHRYLAPQHFEQEIEAMVLVDRESQSLVRMPGYSFSEDSSLLFRAVCSENLALKRQWNDDPLGSWWQGLEPGGNNAVKWRQTQAGRILWEITVYSILQKLSTKIGDYYNQNRFDKQQLAVISRSDAHEILHANRVLDTLSRDPKDRAVFNERFRDNENAFATTISAGGPNGGLYNRFDFKLPKGGTLSHSDQGFTIHTPQVTATITVKVPETNSNTPPYYEKYMLKQPFANTWAFEVNISVAVIANFSLRQLKEQQLAYGWIDFFVSALCEDYSAENYFSSLNWPNVLATVRALESPRGVADGDIDGEQTPVPTALTVVKPPSPPEE